MNGLFHDITRRMFMVFYFSDYGLTSEEDLILFFFETDLFHFS